MVTGAVKSVTNVQQSYPYCTVTVFVTGSGGTKATLYSDNGITPLSNPFTASATGFWFFYAPNGRYDVQLSGGVVTAGGTFPGGPIDTVLMGQGTNNPSAYVPVPNCLIGFSLNYSTITHLWSCTSNGGGPGTVDWATQVTGKPFVQPLCDNSGATDVAACINATISSNTNCPTTGGANTDLGYPSGAGCRVVLQPGQYKITSPLIINKNAVWFQGSGVGNTSILQAGSNQNCFNVGATFDVGISDLSCVGTGTSSSNWAIQVIGNYFRTQIFNFRSVDIANGIKMQDGVEAHIHDVDLRHINGIGILGDQLNSSTIGFSGYIDSTNVDCGGSTQTTTGIAINGAGGFWIDAVDLTSACTTGLVIAPTAGKIVKFGFIGRLSNDSANGANAAIAPDGGGSQVQSVHFSGTWFTTTGSNTPTPVYPRDGMYITATGGAVVHGVFFDGCRFYNNFVNGLEIQGGSAVTDIDTDSSRFSQNLLDDLKIGSNVSNWSLKNSVLGPVDGLSDTETHNLEVTGGTSTNYNVVSNRFQSALNTGTVNTAGTTITAASLSKCFNSNMGNNTIIISGVTYLVATITDCTHLVTTSSAGSQTGALFYYDPTVLDSSNSNNNTIIEGNLFTGRTLCPTLASATVLPVLPGYENCMFVTGTIPIQTISPGFRSSNNRVLTLIFTNPTPAGVVVGGNIADSTTVNTNNPMPCLYQSGVAAWFCTGNGSIGIPGGLGNVLLFGADPTGAADSAPAFQSCVNSIPAQGGGCQVPPGLYSIGSCINMTGGVSKALFGTSPLSNMIGNPAQGAAMLVERTGTNLACVVNVASPLNSLVDLVIDGNAANNSTGLDVVQVNQAGRVRIERITAQNAKRDNIHIVSANGTSNPPGNESCCGRLINSMSINAGRHGVYFYNTNDWFIDITEIENNTGDGLNMDGANEVRMTGGDISGNHGDGINWYCTNPAVEQCGNLFQLMNATFGGNYQHDIYMNGLDLTSSTLVGTGVTIIGNHFIGKNPAATANTYDGVHLQDIVASVVSNNELYTNNLFRYGVSISETGTGNAGNSVVHDNIQNGSSPGTAFFIGTTLTSSWNNPPGAASYLTSGFSLIAHSFISEPVIGVVSSCSVPVTPTSQFFHINGNCTIHNIQASGVAGFAYGMVCAIADTNTWSWDATGNIPVASVGNVVQGQTYCFIYDQNAASWSPLTLH